MIYDINAIKTRVSLIDVLADDGITAKPGAVINCPLPEHEDHNPSCSIFDDGRAFNCFGCGRAGTVLDYVMHRDGIDFCAAVEVLANRYDVPPIKRHNDKQHDGENGKEKWVRVWDEAEPDDGRAMTYYTGRGISAETVQSFVNGIRLHRNLGYWEHGDSGTACTGNYPAIIAPVVNVTGVQTAIHITYLTADGNGKADVPTPKKMWGSCGGSAVRIGDTTTRTTAAITEGIETGLAVYDASGISVYAALSTSGMTTLALPEQVETVHAFGDNDCNKPTENAGDQAGGKAATTLATRLVSEGRTVYVEIPATPGTDWLDVYNKDGPDAIVKTVEVAEPWQPPGDEPQTLRRFPAPVNAVTWLGTEIKKPGAVVLNVVDMASKCLLIGPSKSRKTWFAIQMALCIATGRPFLRWETIKRRVLMVNLELGEWANQARFRNIMSATGITSDIIERNVAIVNGRGYDLTLDTDNGNSDTLIDDINDGGFEVVVIDPLYKLMQGDENKAEDCKPVLSAFDRICTNTGAAIVYIHHDAKGNAGDRQKSDRGAGSNILQRDMDAGIYLTPHAHEGLVVCGTLLRNYPPQDDFTLEFYNGQLKVSDIPPTVKTSTTRKATETDDEQQARALALFNDELLNKGEAMSLLRDAGGFTSRDAGKTLKKLVDTGKLAEHSPRTFPACKKIGLPEAVENEKTMEAFTHDEDS